MSLNLGMIGRNQIRLVRQNEAAECGLASMAMIANYHGLDVDLASLRQRFPTSLRGAALKTLIGTADRLGLAARAVRAPIERIGDLKMPAILHWDLNHYVVLERMRGNKALVHNPDGRSRWFTRDEMSPHFTGVALELEPTSDFVTGKSRVSLRLTQLWGRARGLKRALVKTIVLSLIMQAYIVALPYYTQIAVDTALPALDANLLVTLAIGFGLFAAMNAGASLLRSFVLLSAGTSISFGIASNITVRLMKLPIDWFEKRSVGDILSRYQSITPIQNLMTQGAASTLVDGSLSLVTLLMMYLYSAVLATIALCAFGFYLAVRLITFQMQRQAQEESIVAHGKEQTTLIETLRGITPLRLYGREPMRVALWQSRFTDALNADVRMQRVTIWQDVSRTLIFAIENVIAIWLAINFVMQGGFSVGMVFAYMAYRTQFTDKTTRLIEQAILFRMLGLHLSRLSDIALSDEDECFSKSIDQQTEFKGAIELRGITFRYSPVDPLILNGSDLKISPGEHIAITGPSGSGKSTLIKLLLGLADPHSGDVLIDNMPLDRFGHRSYREQIAAVMQDDQLFTGSLADNIALFDDETDRQAVVEAAISASVHHDIMAMPMGYETLVGDMGSSLSGGQKQRILLARALYRKPRLLLMDEGTAHLDAIHERAVSEAIASSGITRIIIAHRAETLARADRIFVLKGGTLTEGAPAFLRTPSAK